MLSSSCLLCFKILLTNDNDDESSINSRMSHGLQRGLLVSRVPRGGVGWGARVGWGGRGVLGIPLLENRKVYWFIGFFFFGGGFLVSWFDSFSFKDLLNFHFMFLEHDDLISKFFKILLDGSPSFFGARIFEN